MTTRTKNIEDYSEILYHVRAEITNSGSGLAIQEHLKIEISIFLAIKDYFVAVLRIDDLGDLGVGDVLRGILDDDPGAFSNLIKACDRH